MLKVFKINDIVKSIAQYQVTQKPFKPTQWKRRPCLAVIDTTLCSMEGISITAPLPNRDHLN